MLPIGTEVTLNESILEETDRKQSFYLFERIINEKRIGKVEKHEGDQMWVRFHHAAILLVPHNVDVVAASEN